MGRIADAVGVLFAPRADDNTEKRPPPDGDDFWYEPVGAGQSQAGVSVTVSTAVKASALFSCLKVLAETIASLELHMFERVPNGGKRIAENHPLEDLIAAQPNAENTAVEFWEMMVLHGVMLGTAYAEKVPGRRGAVDQLLPLQSDRMVVERLTDRRLRFRYSDPDTGEQRIFLQDELLRIPFFSRDGVTGMRAVDYASEAIGLSLAAQGYSSDFFRNNARPGLVFEHPGKLGADAQRNFIHQWMLRHAGLRRQHRPAVLQEGMKANVITATARDSQLVEMRKEQIAEIARFFRIPLHMLGITEGEPRANVEQLSMEFVRYTIRPLVRRIELALRRDCIVRPERFMALFLLDSLLRGDSITRAQRAASGIQNGWLTRNEVRVSEGMNPLPGLDDPTPPNNGQALGGNQGGGGRRDDAPAQQDGEEEAAALPAPIRVLESAAQRVVSREIAAARKMAEKLDVVAFDAWARSFYGSHAQYVQSQLCIGAHPARVYCEYQRDELLRANQGMGVEPLLAKWEASRADELAATLAKEAA